MKKKKKNEHRPMIEVKEKSNKNPRKNAVFAIDRQSSYRKFKKMCAHFAADERVNGAFYVN